VEMDNQIKLEILELERISVAAAKTGCFSSLYKPLQYSNGNDI